MRPAQVGPYTIEVVIDRTGRSLSNARAQIIQGGSVIASAPSVGNGRRSNGTAPLDLTVQLLAPLPLEGDIARSPLHALLIPVASG